MIHKAWRLAQRGVEIVVIIPANAIEGSERTVDGGAIKRYRVNGGVVPSAAVSPPGIGVLG